MVVKFLYLHLCEGRAGAGPVQKCRLKAGHRLIKVLNSWQSLQQDDMVGALLSNSKSFQKKSQGDQATLVWTSNTLQQKQSPIFPKRSHQSFQVLRSFRPPMKTLTPSRPPAPGPRPCLHVCQELLQTILKSCRLHPPNLACCCAFVKVNLR